MVTDLMEYIIVYSFIFMIVACCIGLGVCCLVLALKAIRGDFEND